MRACSLWLALAALSSVSAPASSAPPVVVREVNVVTLDSRGVIESASVVARNGKIDAILAKGEKLPADATVIDGSGKYLIPGLIDAHVHFEAEKELTSFLRYGVTTVFSLGTRDPDMPAMLKAMERQRNGAFVGAHLYATGPSIANHRKIGSAAEVSPFFDYLRANRLSFPKVYNETSQPVFDEVVRQAKTRKMGVFGHLPRRFPIEYSLTHGLNVVVHMEEFFFAKFNDQVTDSALPRLRPDWRPDYNAVYPLLRLARDNQVAIIPNLVASHIFRNWWVDEDKELAIEDAQYLDAEVREGWRKYNYSRRNMPALRQLREEIKYPFISAMTYRAQQEGVQLLAGTDSPIPGAYPGRSLHQELRLLVAAGLSNEQALKAATINAGDVSKRMIDPATCIGAIQVSCEADLVLIDSNPLDDIRNTAAIAGVMADGRWHSKAELDRMVASARDAKR